MYYCSTVGCKLLILKSIVIQPQTPVKDSLEAHVFDYLPPAPRPGDFWSAKAPAFAFFFRKHSLRKPHTRTHTLPHKQFFIGWAYGPRVVVILNAAKYLLLTSTVNCKPCDMWHRRPRRWNQERETRNILFPLHTPQRPLYYGIHHGAGTASCIYKSGFQIVGWALRHSLTLAENWALRTVNWLLNHRFHGLHGFSK